jgi:probable rRNA maturation factor
MRMEIQNLTADKINLTKILKSAKHAAAKLMPRNSSISVVFINNARMRKINRLYTGRQGTTDVLAFPLGTAFHDGAYHAEIIISVEKARSDARHLNVSPMERLISLVIHGISHLAGYDHHDLDMFRKMKEVEFLLLCETL